MGPTTTAYLKVSPSKQNYTRETAAYRQAAGSLGHDHSPRLIATDPARRAILATALAGTPVRELPLSPSEQVTVHRHAGQLLRRWHDHPVHVPLQARDEVRTAMAAYAREAAACLGALGGQSGRRSKARTMVSPRGPRHGRSARPGSLEPENAQAVPLKKTEQYEERDRAGEDAARAAQQEARETAHADWAAVGSQNGMRADSGNAAHPLPAPPPGEVCGSCGAWVINHSQHHAWHRDIEPQIRRTTLRSVHSPQADAGTT